MVANRPDWCIFRQRTWACPSPCSSTRTPRNCRRNPCA
ncbi:hypothetical protein ACNKHX_00170 [Shigella flexneri]